MTDSDPNPEQRDEQSPASPPFVDGRMKAWLLLLAILIVSFAVAYLTGFLR
ncbi:MAG: hypothetical protein U0528_17375 [Anaerolineae bacterium]|nr:hypothetical protein [Anaerolineae bacterium]